MAGLDTTFANKILKLIFQNQPIENFGTSSGIQASASNGDLEIALIKTNGQEADYGGYARQTINRDVASWGNVEGKVDNNYKVEFPISTSGTNEINAYKIYYGSNNELMYASLDNIVTINVSSKPVFGVKDLDIYIQASGGIFYYAQAMSPIGYLESAVCANINTPLTDLVYSNTPTLQLNSIVYTDLEGNNLKNGNDKFYIAEGAGFKINTSGVVTQIKLCL